MLSLNDSTKKDTVSEPVLTAQQKNLKNEMKEIKTRYERPLFGDVRRIRRRRDVCAAQYQGRKAFRGWQSLKARTGCDLCEDCRNTKNHGKCTCDGLGHALKTNIYRLADDDYGPGTRNLLRQLALRFPGPRKSRQTRYAKTCVSRGGGNVGILSPDSYLYIFYPSDSFKLNWLMPKKVTISQAKTITTNQRGLMQMIAVSSEERWYVHVILVCLEALMIVCFRDILSIKRLK